MGSKTQVVLKVSGTQGSQLKSLYFRHKGQFVGAAQLFLGLHGLRSLCLASHGPHSQETLGMKALSL